MEATKGRQGTTNSRPYGYLMIVLFEGSLLEGTELKSVRNGNAGGLFFFLIH